MAKRLIFSAIIVLAIVAFSFLGWFLTDTNCLIQAVSGLPCPGCGMTRAGLALLKLDFKNAFFFHPLFFLVPIVAVLLLITLIKPEFQKSRFFKVSAAAFSAAFIICYIIRMILYFPHTEPLDYNTKSLSAKILEFFAELFR